jgi:hypothetical protein
MILLKKSNICFHVIVALTETFPLLRALLNLLKESLGRSKPATNLNTSTLTH